VQRGAHRPLCMLAMALTEAEPSKAHCAGLSASCSFKQGRLRAAAASIARPTVPEAGCGSVWTVHVADAAARGLIRDHAGRGVRHSWHFLEF
jgi:hypothetical protein